MKRFPLLVLLDIALCRSYSYIFLSLHLKCILLFLYRLLNWRNCRHLCMKSTTTTVWILHTLHSWLRLQLMKPLQNTWNYPQKVGHQVGVLLEARLQELISSIVQVPGAATGEHHALAVEATKTMMTVHRNLMSGGNQIVQCKFVDQLSFVLIFFLVSVIWRYITLFVVQVLVRFRGSGRKSLTKSLKESEVDLCFSIWFFDQCSSLTLLLCTNSCMVLLYCQFCIYRFPLLLM